MTGANVSQLLWNPNPMMKPNEGICVRCFHARLFFYLPFMTVSVPRAAPGLKCRTYVVTFARHRNEIAAVPILSGEKTEARES